MTRRFRRFQRMIGLWRLARPLFLLGGVTLFGLGVLMAIVRGAQPSWPIVLLALLTVIAGQLLTHVSNDYFDREADAANATPTPWSGGSRAIVEGEVSPVAARRALWAIGLIAILLLALLIIAGRSEHRLELPALVAFALGLSWAYSSPPARLHTRGLGELIGALLLAIITPMAGLAAAGGQITLDAALPLVPLALFQFAMLVSVSLPDRRGDASSGKRTLAVRWGGAAAARAAAAAIGLGFLATGLQWAAGTVPIAVGYLLWLPLGVHVSTKLLRQWDNPADWPSLGFWSIGLVMGSAWTTALGWWLMRGAP